MTAVHLNTLYVTLPEAYLRLDNDTIRVDVERETRLRVPLHHLGSVVCLGNALVSTPLIHRLAEDGIGVVLLDANGRFKARVEGPTSGNVLVRIAQQDKARDPGFARAVASACIAGKVGNARQVLLRGAREAKSEDDRAVLARGADDLAAGLRSLPARQTLDELRGQEGDAAQRYFACLSALMRSDARAAFTMNGRTRRPPRDRMNALLSFLYALLMNDCRSAVEAAGLDPQIGFLHAVRPGRAALALDLMEEFRPIADRLAITLVNRGQLGPDDFVVRDGGAVLLEGDARKTVLLAYQERKQEELRHPLLEAPVALGLVPLIQARLLSRTIRDETPGYIPFLLR
jgi:CRISPR-associated protein Cas1